MSCPPANCPIPVDPAEDDLVQFFKRFKDSERCFTQLDGLMNLFGAQKDIALAIREYADTVRQKGYASAVLTYRLPAASQTVGTTNIQIARSPFNYKVTGFGVSCKLFNASGGTYGNDDILRYKLWDYTANVQIGNTLTLNSTTLHGNHTDEGNPIGPNITPGHIYGIRVEYTNTDGGAFNSSDVDVFIHVEPMELVTTI